MTLPVSGQLSLSALQTEFGGTNPISLSEYYASGGFVPANTGIIPIAGQNSLSNYYGTSAVVPTLLEGSTGVTTTHANLGSLAPIVFGDAGFVLSPSNTTNVSTSPDGRTWTVNTVASGAVTGMTTITGESRLSYSPTAGYILLCLSSTNNLVTLTSTNGLTWTSQGAPSFSSIPPNNYTVKTGPAIEGFIGGVRTWVLAMNGTPARSTYDSIARCTSLTAWTRYSDTLIGNSTSNMFVNHYSTNLGGTGLFIRAGGWNINNKMHTSPNAATWTSYTIVDSVTGLDAGISPYVSAYNCATNPVGPIFVSMTAAGRPIVSTDGVNFTMYPAVPNAQAAVNPQLAFGNGYFVMSGATNLASPYTRGIWTSVDGITWTRANHQVSAYTGPPFFTGTEFVWIAASSTYSVLA